MAARRQRAWDGVQAGPASRQTSALPRCRAKGTTGGELDGFWHFGTCFPFHRVMSQQFLLPGSGWCRESTKKNPVSILRAPSNRDLCAPAPQPRCQPPVKRAAGLRCAWWEASVPGEAAVPPSVLQGRVLPSKIWESRESVASSASVGKNEPLQCKKELENVAGA